MDEAGKDVATRETLLAILDQQRRMRAELADLEASNGAKQIRSIAIDTRTVPVALVAEALSVVLAWNTDVDPAAGLGELRRCLDGLLALHAQLPRAAARQFNALDEFVQVLMLAGDSRAFAAAREPLQDRLQSLGRVLMDALLPPPVPEVNVIPTRKYRWKKPREC